MANKKRKVVALVNMIKINENDKIGKHSDEVEETSDSKARAAEDNAVSF